MAMQSLFGEKLQTKDGLQDTSQVLAGKGNVGIYFSAHWCPPCRGFTPKLAESYLEMKAAESRKTPSYQDLDGHRPEDKHTTK